MNDEQPGFEMQPRKIRPGYYDLVTGVSGFFLGRLILSPFMPCESAADKAFVGSISGVLLGLILGDILRLATGHRPNRDCFRFSLRRLAVAMGFFAACGGIYSAGTQALEHLGSGYDGMIKSILIVLTCFPLTGAAAGIGLGTLVGRPTWAGLRGAALGLVALFVTVWLWP